MIITKSVYRTNVGVAYIEIIQNCRVFITCCTVFITGCVALFITGCRAFIIIARAILAILL
jgi:hypothetical protein